MNIPSNQSSGKINNFSEIKEKFKKDLKKIATDVINLKVKDETRPKGISKAGAQLTKLAHLRTDAIVAKVLLAGLSALKLTIFIASRRQNSEKFDPDSDEFKEELKKLEEERNACENLIARLKNEIEADQAELEQINETDNPFDIDYEQEIKESKRQIEIAEKKIKVLDKSLKKLAELQPVEERNDLERVIEDIDLTIAPIQEKILTLDEELEVQLSALNQIQVETPNVTYEGYTFEYPENEIIDVEVHYKPVNSPESEKPGQ